MKRRAQNQSFICNHCNQLVYALTNGSYRNHCPFCLHSVHVDNHPGDRSNDCLGLMKPVGIIHNSKKGLQIKHRCSKCGVHKVNKIAQNTVQEDDYEIILKLLKE